MLRKTGLLAALLLISQGLGCAMCACPYDYTGPVPAEGFGFLDRAGSVLQAGGINEGEWNAEMDQDAMGGTIVDPGQNSIPQSVPQGEPVLAPQPEPGFAPQTRGGPQLQPQAQPQMQAPMQAQMQPQLHGYQPQARPVVQRAGRVAPGN